MTSDAAALDPRRETADLSRLPVGVLGLDAVLRVTRVDSAFCRIFGCDAADVEDRLLEDLVAPTDRRAIRKLHTGLCRYSGGFVDFAVELRVVANAPAHARVRVTPDEGGSATAYVERIEDGDLVYELLLARERWSALFRGSEDGVVVLSPDGKIVEHNHRFYSLCQFRSAHGVLLSEDALVGRPIGQLLPAAVLHALEERPVSHVIGGRQLELRMNRLALPVRGAVGTCVVVRDVSERAQIEELRVRNAEAHYAGMAEVANNLLHNLGNLCGSVLFSTEELLKALHKSVVPRMNRATAMMKEREPDLASFLTTDPKGKLLPEFFLRIGEALETERSQLLASTTDLMTKVRLIKDTIAAQQTYAKGTRYIETLDLDQIVDDALGIEASAFVRHGVELVRSGGHVGNVRAQRSKLVHVLLNLMRNARDAMEGQTEPRVLTIETGRNRERRGFVRVTDTGKGVPPELRSRIFTHGFTTKRTGHGFGLHFCALAVEEMHGVLALESDKAGRGASFVVTLSGEGDAPSPPTSPAASRAEGERT